MKKSLLLIGLIIACVGCGVPDSSSSGDSYILATEWLTDYLDSEIIVVQDGDNYTFQATHEGYLDLTGTKDAEGNIELDAQHSEPSYHINCSFDYADSVDEYQGSCTVVTSESSGEGADVTYIRAT